MRTKLGLTLTILVGFFTNAQTISIVGTGVNGWPENQTTPEIVLTTVDNISYTSGPK